MSDQVVVSRGKLVAVADAIRTKGETTEELTLDAMVDAIESIETGGNVAEAEAIIDGLLVGRLTEIVNDRVTSLRTNCFADGSYWASLKLARFKNVTTIGNSVFYNCRDLKEIRLDSVTSIGTSCFYLTSTLRALILGAPTVCTVGNGNFNNSFVSGTGYIYVPKALVEDYKVATNWSVVASQFRAIEDYPEITGG